MAKALIGEAFSIRQQPNKFHNHFLDVVGVATGARRQLDGRGLKRQPGVEGIGKCRRMFSKFLTVSVCGYHRDTVRC
jgi:hypothetical protein